VLFIITQQVQPSFIMQAIASQQDWIISMHLESPLVQVIMTPSFVMSHLHIPIIRLQQQTIMPFIMTQQLHMPPASIVHRFCIMPQAALSAAVQVIFMPPVHFSILIVHRGTIIQLAAGIVGAVPMAGVAMRFDAVTGGWLPQADWLGRTSLAGVFVAGDGDGLILLFFDAGTDRAFATGRSINKAMS